MEDKDFEQSCLVLCTHLPKHCLSSWQKVIFISMFYCFKKSNSILLTMFFVVIVNTLSEIAVRIILSNFRQMFNFIAVLPCF